MRDSNKRLELLVEQLGLAGQVRVGRGCIVIFGRDELDVQRKIAALCGALEPWQWPERVVTAIPARNIAIRSKPSSDPPPPWLRMSAARRRSTFFDGFGADAIRAVMYGI